MEYPHLEIERRDAVVTLWLNRPDVHNAFDEVLIASLTTALKELDVDDSVRVVVLAGRGRSFCAGGDLNWMRRMSNFTPQENLLDATRLADMLYTLATLSKPTVARVQGAALAGATGLVAACDIAVASTQASFGTTEVRLGLIPATISPYVINAIGARAARRYFLTGERINAQEALRLGLIHALCEPEALDRRVSELIATLLDAAPAAQRACKRLVDDMSHRSITPALLADTSERIADARASVEAREGIDAFFNKRKPLWVA